MVHVLHCPNLLTEPGHDLFQCQLLSRPACRSMVPCPHELLLHMGHADMDKSLQRSSIVQMTSVCCNKSTNMIACCSKQDMQHKESNNYSPGECTAASPSTASDGFCEPCNGGVRALQHTTVMYASQHRNTTIIRNRTRIATTMGHNEKCCSTNKRRCVAAPAKRKVLQHQH